jgi:tetratricopeptide (TPR) repeat protein
MAEKDFASAESLLRDLLSTLDRQSAVEPLKVPALNYLAFLLAERNKLPEAESLARESYELAVQLIGPNHVFTAHPLFVLAGIEAQQGRTQDSDRHFNQALDIYASSYGTHHPMYAKALDDFSYALQKAGRKADAKRLRGQARSINVGNASAPGLTPVVIDVSDLHARSRR